MENRPSWFSEEEGDKLDGVVGEIAGGRPHAVSFNEDCIVIHIFRNVAVADQETARLNDAMGIPRSGVVPIEGVEDVD